MTRRNTAPLLVVLITLGVMLDSFVQAQDTATPAHAGEVPTLDQAVFIDGLSKGGYPELLARMIEINPPQTDFEKLQIQVASDRLMYQQLLDRSRQVAQTAGGNQNQILESIELKKDSESAFESMLEGMIELTSKFPEEDLRPMWQTDLAETLLGTYVGSMHQNADMFSIYGVATQEQLGAFAKAASESYVALTDADSGFTDRQVLLPREDDHVQKRVNTGLWDIMMEQYWKQLLPFFHSQAALYMAEAPESAAYYQTLTSGGDNRIPGQKNTVTEERKRLYQFAIDQGDVFISNSGGNRPAAERQILATQGMAQLKLGNPTQAIDLFDQVITANDPAPYTLRAGLGRAYALAATNNIPAARQQLQDLAKMQLVRDFPAYRLLLADAEHRILLQAAEKMTGAEKTKAIADAYEPYIVMFEDGSLGDNVQSMQMLVYNRWNETAAGQDMMSLPPAVRLGIAESAMMEAQRLMVQGKQEQDANKLAQAIAKFEQAIVGYKTLRSNDIKDSIKATAMYNEGLAHYQIGQATTDGRERLNRTLGAVTIWVTLGREIPDHPNAIKGLDFASQLLAHMHSQDPKPAGVDVQYPKTVELLLEKFNDHVVTHNQRLYYGMVILIPQQNWQEAMELFAAVPTNHRDYFAAQRERLLVLSRWLASLDSEQLQTELEKLKEVAGVGDQAKTNIISDIEAQANRAVQGNDRIETATEALMAAVITRARIATMRSRFEDRQSNLEAAVSALQDFEQRFPSDPRYTPLALETRLLALSELGKIEDVSKQATAMMQQYPAEGAVIINSLLTDIETEVDQLTAKLETERVPAVRKELQDRIARISKTASSLADELFENAKANGIQGDELLPYILIRVKTKSLAGDHTEALGIIKPLFERNPKELAIMTAYAGALQAEGSPQSLAEAQRIYNELIQFYSQESPLPSGYWESWVGFLESSENLGQKKDISVWVRQLQGTDPNLGGQPYKRQLEDLQQRN